MKPSFISSRNVNKFGSIVYSFYILSKYGITFNQVYVIHDKWIFVRYSYEHFL